MQPKQNKPELGDNDNPSDNVWYYEEKNYILDNKGQVIKENHKNLISKSSDHRNMRETCCSNVLFKINCLQISCYYLQKRFSIVKKNFSLIYLYLILNIITKSYNKKFFLSNL